MGKSTFLFNVQNVEKCRKGVNIVMQGLYEEILVRTKMAQSIFYFDIKIYRTLKNIVKCVIFFVLFFTQFGFYLNIFTTHFFCPKFVWAQRAPGPASPQRGYKQGACRAQRGGGQRAPINPPHMLEKGGLQVECTCILDPPPCLNIR